MTEELSPEVLAALENEVKSMIVNVPDYPDGQTISEQRRCFIFDLISQNDWDVDLMLAACQKVERYLEHGEVPKPQAKKSSVAQLKTI